MDIIDQPATELESRHQKQRLFLAIGLVALLTLVLTPYRGVYLPKMVVLIGGIGAILTLLAVSVRRVDFAVMLLVGYIPFSRILVGDFDGLFIGLNAFNILFLVVLWGLVNRQLRDAGLFFTTLDFPLLLYMLLTTIALIRGGNALGQGYMLILFTNLVRWLMPMLLYFLIVNVIEERQLRKDIIITICSAVFFVGLLGLKEFYVDMGGAGSSWEKSRIGGISQQPNQLGAFFVYYLPFTIAFFMAHLSQPRYWTLLLPILTSLRALTLTVSRGAFISFGASLALLIVMRNKLFVLFVITAAMLLSIFPQMLPETVVGRFEGMVKDHDVVQEGGVEKRLEGSSRIRVYAFQGGLKMVAEHPWLGVGYNMYPYLIHDYMPVLEAGRDTHNTYMTIAAEMGLPALFIFLLVLALIMNSTLYVYRHSDDTFMRTAAQGFLAGMAGLLISNIFGSRINALELSGYVWILAAVFMRESREIRMKQREDDARALSTDEHG
jgi:O-antigen ligase